MAITNKGGFDDLEAQDQEENLGTRRKIGFGKPAPSVEFTGETPDIYVDRTKESEGD